MRTILPVLFFILNLLPSLVAQAAIEKKSGFHPETCTLEAIVSSEPKINSQAERRPGFKTVSVKLKSYKGQSTPGFLSRNDCLHFVNRAVDVQALIVPEELVGKVRLGAKVELDFVSRRDSANPQVISRFWVVERTL